MPSAMTGQIPEGRQYDALLGSALTEYPQIAIKSAAGRVVPVSQSVSMNISPA